MFMPGDVVQLKSGGPDMTVAKTSAQNDLSMTLKSNQFHCIWFTKDFTLKNEIFTNLVLEKVR